MSQLLRAEEHFNVQVHSSVLRVGEILEHVQQLWMQALRDRVTWVGAGRSWQLWLGAGSLAWLP